MCNYICGINNSPIYIVEFCLNTTCFYTLFGPYKHWRTVCMLKANKKPIRSHSHTFIYRQQWIRGPLLKTKPAYFSKFSTNFNASLGNFSVFFFDSIFIWIWSLINWFTNIKFVHFATIAIQFNCFYLKNDKSPIALNANAVWLLRINVASCRLSVFLQFVASFVFRLGVRDHTKVFTSFH